MPTNAFTIRKLADAAGVGVEAVRYYQRGGLLDSPKRVDGRFRQYVENDVRRLLFIKRAQALGFSLEDIKELMSLSSASDRLRAREITRQREAEIRRRIADLQSMASALGSLADCCAQSPVSSACSIIAALTDSQGFIPTTVDVSLDSPQGVAGQCPSVRSGKATARLPSGVAS